MIPNFLSFIRIPFGIAFLFVSAPIRLLLTLGAAISDGLDGFIARRWNLTSKLGTLLDPLGDKIFAGLAFGALYLEETISLSLFLSLFAREGALLLFTGWLKIRGRWDAYTIQSFTSGKIFTGLQFIWLLFLLLGLPFPSLLPFIFGGLGVTSLIELLCREAFNQKRALKPNSPEDPS